MKILITGFEPFGGEKINPSSKLVSEISNQGNIFPIVLPVSYQRSFLDLKKILDQNRSIEHVIMLGQAGGRKNISLERVALNWLEADQPDCDGEVYQGQKINSLLPDAFFTQYPIKHWEMILKEQKIPIEISLSAGSYVCNSLYYNVQKYLLEQKRNFKNIFIHLPFLPEQIETKPLGTPYLEFEKMKTAMEAIIENLEVS